MDYFKISDMNEASRDPAEFIRWSQERYDAKVEAAAIQILEAAEQGKPLVLLSGPSGSGKTTTAGRITQYLCDHGHPSHTLSMDNYYFRRADGWMPKDEEGQIDYESPEIIDMPLLRQHLEMMADCKPVEMPTFDFAGQRRGDKTIPVHRKPGEIIVMEGIHALNPQVLGQETDLATGIYISVRTRVQDDNGFVLHPSRIRLARRLLRDFRHRGQDYAATVQKLRSVSRGERLYIDPNKNNAAIHFDTFIPYELAVYRNEIIHYLSKVDATLLEDLGVSELMPFLRQIDPISEKYVPENALIQEFIGDED